MLFKYSKPQIYDYDEGSKNYKIKFELQKENAKAVRDRWIPQKLIIIELLLLTKTH